MEEIMIRKIRETKIKVFKRMKGLIEYHRIEVKFHRVNREVAV